MATGTNGLAGRVAIVTGAGAGIGRAIAAELVVRGAAVAIIDRDADAGERAATSLAEAGEAAFFEADVADAASVEAAVAGVARAYQRIDIAVNNAGILDGFLPVLDTDEQLWDRVLDVNLKGVFLVTKAALPHMIGRGGGVFVNMASAAGLVGGLGGIAYTASKHAIIGFTRQLVVDYGHQGIRANAICPGSIDTELSRTFLKDHPDVVELVNSVPAGRQGDPSEVARLAAFLAGEDSSFITGAALPIDGGWTSR
jgi:3-oxoacyl-[acyl-carrier protein] reductase